MAGFGIGMNNEKTDAGTLMGERKNYAGISSEEYDCTIVILGQKVPVKLVHYLTESRWVMNFK